MIKEKVLNNPNLLGRFGSVSVPQGVKEVSHFGSKFQNMSLNHKESPPDHMPFLGLDLIDPCCLDIVK